MPERTVTVRMLDAPDYGTLDIELRYLHNKDMSASSSDAFIEGDQAREIAFFDRFAQHVIKGWSAGEYTAAAGLAWILKLREMPGGDAALHGLVKRAMNPADFAIPRLVDAGDLGNE